MISRLRRRQHDERGAVAVVVALMMVVLTLCAAIVVDLGNAKDVRRQSQNAADASALAAANVLYPANSTCTSGSAPCISDAVSAIKSYALNNFNVAAAAWTTCSAAVADRLTYTPSGESTCISFDSSTSPTQVRVYIPVRSVSTFFGGMTGKSSIPVGSSAQAVLGLTVKCSLCFLGSVDAGNADFTAVGGGIAVNGNASGGPNSNWTATSIGVVGTASAGTFSPAATTIPSFTDPYATSLTLPLSTTGLAAKSDPCNDGPGLYGDADIPKTTCTLKPGLYVISGTWGMKNNSYLTGTGVTLYVKSPGALDFKNGDVNITAPTTGALARFAVIYDRNNTNNLGLQGNGNTSIDGITYAPTSSLDFNGNSCFGFNGGPVIVAGVIKANGNKSCVKVTNPVDATVSRKAQYLNR